MAIHSTAIISSEAIIHDSAEIGPYSIVKGRVKIGAGTKIESHVVIGSDYGTVEIGDNNFFSPGGVIGGAPQDLKYNGENTQLIIGNNNIIREYCTLNLGTASGGGKTVIGSNNMFMAYVHIAHDCILSDYITIANATHLAGHVEIADHVRVGGVCAMTQFVKLGRYSYIAGDSAVNKDVCPFAIAKGNFATMRATNKIGLERAGFSKEEVANIHKALRMILKGDNTIEATIEEIEKSCMPSEHITTLIEFAKNSKNGLAR